MCSHYTCPLEEKLFSKPRRVRIIYFHYYYYYYTCPLEEKLFSKLRRVRVLYRLCPQGDFIQPALDKPVLKKTIVIKIKNKSQHKVTRVCYSLYTIVCYSLYTILIVLSIHSLVMTLSVYMSLYSGPDFRERQQQAALCFFFVIVFF